MCHQGSIRLGRQHAESEGMMNAERYDMSLVNNTNFETTK